MTIVCESPTAPVRRPASVMVYGLPAGLIVIVHLGFIAFIGVRGFLAWRCLHRHGRLRPSAASARLQRNCKRDALRRGALQATRSSVVWIQLPSGYRAGRSWLNVTALGFAEAKRHRPKMLNGLAHR